MKTVELDAEMWRRYSEASIELFDVLLQENRPEMILDSLVRILGEVLHVDRSLIYDVSFTHEHARCLTEWLDPEHPELTATKATYPLTVFRGGATHLRDSRTWLVSHASAPHAALVADGSAALLHRDMRIQSLLWYPFMFRDDGFYALVFNHVTLAHEWRADEIDFMRTATRHVTMALLKIEMLEQRARSERALAEAQRLESLGLLAGGIAHDFNNLMVGVTANAELVKRGLAADSPLRTYASDILYAGERAAALAGQLLAYAGKGSAATTLLEPCGVIDDTARLLRSTFPNIDVQVIDEGAPIIECNRVQLEQVLMNLLVNAAEATLDRKGTIRVRCATLALDADIAAEWAVPPGAYALMQVTDRGTGMDAATVARIFDPFYTTKFTGRGLGLSAVQGIVKHHGGAIRVRSAVGHGSTFFVLWPQATDRVATAKARGSVQHLAPARVLVIDDDPRVLSSVTALLADRGVTCDAALGGSSGLETYRAHQGEIDCVLLDMTMPPPNGTEVLRELRELSPDQAVVLMSGYSEQTFAGRDIAGRRTRFIKKPFAADDLVAVLAAATEA